MPMMLTRVMPAATHWRAWFLALPALVAPIAPAQAQLAVSQLIVDLKPAPARSQDVELFNESAERSYVSIEPREIINPGTPDERSVTSPDPEKLGLLVSPRRLILEPGQRRIVRIARIGPDALAERIYRVTIKPVVGDVAGETGLKLLVGYDLLVLARPVRATRQIDVNRTGTSLAITNRGNASVELVDGRQCDGASGACAKLPGKRLYAGATWRQDLPARGGGEYRVRASDGPSILKF
jgi:P pilus assembly chaperone PapD